LRGFAILVVLLYHARLGILPAGYLGVDVFFVISGFLITRLVKEGIERGAFRFSEFYFRRAKRLLPAAYVVFLCATIAAPYFLASSEMRDFRTQLIGAVTFTANFVLWRQSGYFSGEAELKPLLHTWSLSIEEQYYLVVPALMVLIPRRMWKPAAMVVLAVSSGLCLMMVAERPAATFYLLPTRAWELAIGSLGALIVLGDAGRRWVRAAFWPAMLALVALPVAKMSPFHPGLDAMAICAATLVIIWRNHPALSGGTMMRPLSWLGDISYSLYLVHWPIFAFMSNSWLGGGAQSDSPVGWRIGLVLVSILLAIALNRYVEEPVRRARIAFEWRYALRGFLVSIGLVGAAIAVSLYGVPGKDYAHVRRVNYGLSAACEFGSAFTPSAHCQSGDAPRILVWGDSYAMHLVPGILADAGSGMPLVQATRSLCGPLVNVAPIKRGFVGGYDQSWASSCMAFNDSVIRYLATASSVNTVVLSTSFTQYLDDKRYQLLLRGPGDRDGQIVDAGPQRALEGIGATVARVRALGKRVAVVAPPPQATFDVGRCLERLESGLVTLGIMHGCRIDVGIYRSDRGAVLHLLEALPREVGVNVVDFDSDLCDSVACMTRLDGEPIYRDAGHLSVEGSSLVAKRVQLMRRIQEAAH
jgi:peptidoglycan/LPS O-acetylase OafA/YrhL